MAHIAPGPHYPPPTPGSGFENADFVLYVSTVNSDRCKMSGTVAYAAYCQLEAETDRPLAGYVNICPTEDTLSNAAHQYASLLSTVILCFCWWEPMPYSHGILSF